MLAKLIKLRVPPLSWGVQADAGECARSTWRSVLFTTGVLEAPEVGLSPGVKFPSQSFGGRPGAVQKRSLGGPPTATNGNYRPSRIFLKPYVNTHVVRLHTNVGWWT